MKVLVVIFAVIGSILAAREAKGYNGLAVRLAKQGGLLPLGLGRIIGGVYTPIDQVPYIVTMQRFGAHRCGGVIISASRILTAAHCTILIPVTQLSIRAGSSANQSGGQEIQTARIVNHPQYNAATLNNDIAIMHLSSELDLSPIGVAIIGMPPQGAGTAAGTIARVSGWGALTEGGDGSALLQAVDVPVVTNAVCNGAWDGGITDGMICAGFPEGGRDTCQGDSGGPLTTGNQVVGIASWIDGCGRPNAFGVYTRVSHYRNWINAN